MPLPSRPRAKSITSSIRPAMRSTLALHHRQDLQRLFVLTLAPQKPGRADDRGQRIAQIVTQHGDELLAQFRGFALVGQSTDGGGFPTRERLLVAAALLAAHHANARRQRLAVAVALLDRAGHNGQLFAGGGEEIENDFFEPALQRSTGAMLVS
jgi:hypothetical protein